MTYTVSLDPSGKIVPGYGSLIPDGYQLLDAPDSRWVCPVRDCQKRLKSPIALGGHFGALHKRQAFNDNSDGTLSLVGPYISTGKTSPAIIVSHDPLPANAPPRADPSFPAQAQSQRDDSTSDSGTSKRIADIVSLSAGRQFATQLPPLAPLDEDDPVTYLNSFLAPNQPVPRRGDVQFMAMLRRQRNLPDEWIQFHQNQELDAIHYACALAFIVGEEVVENACTKQYPRGRLSSVCVKLPSNMATRDRQVFSVTVTCVGCKYRSHLQRQTNHCDWQADITLPIIKQRKVAKRELVQSTLTSSDEIEAPPEVPKHKARVRAPRVTELTTEDRMALDSLSPARARDDVLPTVPRRVPESLVNGIHQTHPEAVPADDMSRMEDWEFAPGRQVDATTRECK